MLIKNLKKAVIRIKKAIKEQEKIVLFSDSDLDGVTALIILEEALKNLGAKIATCYFNDRDKEGYGLSEKAVNFFKQYGPGLLILTDCGVGNFQEIELAKKIGLKTIIIDHHLLLDKIPSAEIIIDPHQRSDKYPFKFLCAAGLCFKLCEILLGKKTPVFLKQGFLELAAIATIADKMPLEKDNKIIIEKGLSYLPLTNRPGLKVIWQEFKLRGYPLEKIIQQITWLLQITDIKNHLPENYKLLTCSDEKGSKKLFNLMLKKSLKRQEKIRELSFEIEKKRNPKIPFIFEGGKEFLGLSGAVAQWLLVKFKIPVFIFSFQGKKIKGSARTPQGINTIEIYKKCHSCLEIYGGHAVASGFSLKKKNLEKFKNCLEKEFNTLAAIST